MEIARNFGGVSGNGGAGPVAAEQTSFVLAFVESVDSSRSAAFSGPERAAPQAEVTATALADNEAKRDKANPEALIVLV